MVISKHSEHSSYREKLIEHLFIGELLKFSWQQCDCEIEISKPEVDNAGYDLIVEAEKVVRHVQLKASFSTSTTSQWKVHRKLFDKPSGCVISVVFDEQTLELGPFLFFGSEPNEPLKGIEDLKVARHTKGNKDGDKAERPNIRVVNKGRFEKVDTIEQLVTKLIG
ncbi:hypothetical protein [Curvivirga sp.]|uniref:hypothetical protein n=1 Tax=Curvivirga sp. TaxID=2856848 RepID=UPI003B59963F